MFNVYSDLFFGRLHFFSQKNLKAVAPVHFSYRHGRHGGGTQLFEGAYLTGGDMRFCCETSKSRGSLGVK